MVPPRSQDTAQGKAQTRAQDKIAAIHNSARTRSRRIAAVPDNDRDVYRSLISEATVPEEDRPLKKPRAGRPRQKQPSDTTLHNSAKSSDQPSARGEDASGIQNVQEETPSRPQQTIVDSDESDEEDIDWEDVGLNNVEANPTPPRKDDEFGDVSLEIITKKIQKRAAIAKRKPVTTAEKLLRLEAHEAHLLFLLFHVHVRNAWCNMPEVQVQPPCLSLRLFRQL
jgi:xeroderma pigmentosum group C-complementing protein